MDESSSPREGSRLVLALAYIALAACVLVVLSDVIGWLVVDRHNPITETISTLAIGKYAWIQDLGLDIFGVGLIAAAIALLRWDFGGWRRWVSAALLLLIAGVIFVISEYNQYRGYDDFGGKVHRACSFSLYALVFLLAIFLAFELREIGRRYFLFSLSFAGLWLVGGPLFMFLVPTTVDGAVERLLGLAFVSWVAMLAWLLLLIGRGGDGR
ncbi:DUF998 domain-containing protein [Microbulbifer yueqingensis]|uniref:DUF998 domain-containing protein n=1 Tax=Microbulbifer yueqingensis TaxID=658219 RepID=A0A1G8Z768_9GAMM|nr:DUF998 domain-containing protein [Microbulbifer yueqingensis]SDK10932.1 Protein of unknown function [Microbulbifer yueqingensis]